VRESVLSEEELHKRQPHWLTRDGRSNETWVKTIGGCCPWGLGVSSSNKSCVYGAEFCPSWSVSPSDLPKCHIGANSIGYDCKDHDRTFVSKTKARWSAGLRQSGQCCLFAAGYRISCLQPFFVYALQLTCLQLVTGHLIPLKIISRTFSFPRSLIYHNFWSPASPP